MFLTNLSLGCSSGISKGPFPVLAKPVPPLAVSNPRQAWIVAPIEQGGMFALKARDFDALRAYIIRQNEVISIYECQIIAINGGDCD